MGQRGPVASVTTLPGVDLPPSKQPRPRLKLEPAAPNPPTNLSREAKAEWNRIVPELDAKGLLSKVDRGVLSAYCDAWAQWNRARKELDQGAMVILSGSDRRPAKNPAWQIYAQASVLIAQLGKELFITPNARLRAQLPEADDEPTGQDVLD